jgi:hypothetical protein
VFAFIGLGGDHFEVGGVRVITDAADQIGEEFPQDGVKLRTGSKQIVFCLPIGGQMISIGWGIRQINDGTGVLDIGLFTACLFLIERVKAIGLGSGPEELLIVWVEEADGEAEGSTIGALSPIVKLGDGLRGRLRVADRGG